MIMEFFLPDKIISGSNALESLPDYIKGFGKKALIVTGKTVSTLPCFILLTETLVRAQIEYEIFNDITGEPDDIMINAGVDCFKKSECDFLIAIGGGSPIDAMKAIATLYCSGGKISDYMGKEITFYYILGSFFGGFVVSLVAQGGWSSVTELYGRVSSRKKDDK